MATMQKPLRVAIDTNFPLLLAQEHDDAIEALAVVHERVRPSEILVPPTALGELRYQAAFERRAAQRELALTALTQLLPRWHFQPVDLTSTEAAIAEEAARRGLHADLLPAADRTDAAIISESAVLIAVLVVSNDSHLLDVDHRRLGLLFRELDLPVPLIVSPREIVRKFYR